MLYAYFSLSIRLPFLFGLKARRQRDDRRLECTRETGSKIFQYYRILFRNLRSGSLVNNIPLSNIRCDKMLLAGTV